MPTFTVFRALNLNLNFVPLFFFSLLVGFSLHLCCCIYVALSAFFNDELEFLCRFVSFLAGWLVGCLAFGFRFSAFFSGSVWWFRFWWLVGRRFIALSLFTLCSTFMRFNKVICKSVQRRRHAVLEGMRVVLNL